MRDPKNFNQLIYCFTIPTTQQVFTSFDVTRLSFDNSGHCVASQVLVLNNDSSKYYTTHHHRNVQKRETKLEKSTGPNPNPNPTRTCTCIALNYSYFSGYKAIDDSININIIKQFLILKNISKNFLLI